MSTALDILHRYWGYDSFRDLQADIIDSVAAGKDTLALMPTGGGKSICFQVPALMREGLCLVVTPLIALMSDQVEHLRERGIKAEAIYTGITQREIEIILDNCQFGDYKFLYISPERLESKNFRLRLKQLLVTLIAVDEAHCISQWGYDFRPSYLKIADVRQDFPLAPVLALTATATPDVVKDIQQRLQFKEENVLQKSFLRQNLCYVVRNTDDKLSQLVHILKSVSGSSIVYVRSRQKTSATAEYLTKEGISATHYHAGLSRKEKALKQQMWQHDEVRVMVATNAFGMGIDKPDVRTVVHLDLPDTLEAYFQEAGRAGRDGNTAYAILLYNKTDQTKAKKRISDNYPDKDFIKRVYEAAGDWLEVGIGSGLDHTFAFNFERFCTEKHLPMLPTYSALQILTQAGYLAYTEETETNPRVQFLIERDKLYSETLTTVQDRVIHNLLRTYTGIFADPVYINDNRMADELKMTVKELSEVLISLSREHLIMYIPRLKTPYLTYTLERQPLEYLQLKPDIYEVRRERYIQRLQAMTEYAEQNQFCRSVLLLNYFGETDAKPCGTCDICREHKAHS